MSKKKFTVQCFIRKFSIFILFNWTVLHNTLRIKLYVVFHLMKFKKMIHDPNLCHKVSNAWASNCMGRQMCNIYKKLIQVFSRPLSVTFRCIPSKTRARREKVILAVRQVWPGLSVAFSQGDGSWWTQACCLHS
jgi:hypothetical protein